jgi:hypothetical protein
VRGVGWKPWSGGPYFKPPPPVKRGAKAGGRGQIPRISVGSGPVGPAPSPSQSHPSGQPTRS